MYSKEYNERTATRVYSEHYSHFVECDLCGHQTRGRVYVEEPEVVYCSSCGGTLLGNYYESDDNWVDEL